MGTTIRVHAYRNECSPKLWGEFVAEIKGSYTVHYDDEDSAEMLISCPYSMAYLEHLEYDKEKYAGSGIGLALWYEERDADEEAEL